MRDAVIAVGVTAMVGTLTTGCSSPEASPVSTTSTVASMSSADLPSSPEITPLMQIPGTDQTSCFNNESVITCPSPGDPFFGQDAQYPGDEPRYQDNGDGTVTDLVSGLVWQKEFQRVSYADAPAAASSATTGGFTDWRVPSVTELYSLINFDGNQGSGPVTSTTPPEDAVPFINTEFFDFEYSPNGRYIDAQYVTDTEYTGLVFGDQPAFFGVNFADGRIKGYPTSGNVSNSTYYARFVRGNPDYGTNTFVDNGDGTISDTSTGLMWAQFDSGAPEMSEYLPEGSTGTLNWEQALEFADHVMLGGFADWRVPNAKELQSIVDYRRSPDSTSSPAINPLFHSTPLTNEAGEQDWGAYWTSTTFLPGPEAVVIYFGRALGYTSSQPGGSQAFLDVHGAGAQRTERKTGEAQYGLGPQGDVQRVNNYVRLVRGAS